MKKTKLIIIVTIALVLVIAGVSVFALLGGGSQKSQAAQQENETLEIRDVTTGDITKTVTSEGTVVSSEVVSVKTPVECKISQVHVKTGSQVEQGDALFTLDQDELSQQYQEARVTLTEKMKAAGRTRQSYETITVRAPKDGKITECNIEAQKSTSEILDSAGSLLVMEDEDGNTIPIDIPDEGVVSKVGSLSREGTTVEAGDVLFTVKVLSKKFQTQTDEVTAAKEAVDMLEKYLNDPVVYAEEDGIVDEIKNDETGVLLKKDTTVIRIQSRSGYALKIKVTQSELENISLGQNAEVTFDSGDAVKGSVGHINYKANDNGTFEVTIAMENSDGMLSNVYPGVTGKVTIELDKKEGVLRVPLEAVKQDNDGEYVMVYTGDSEDIAGYDVSTIPMEKRYIERGATNSLFAEVLSGLRGDEKVVIAKTSADSGVLSFLSGNIGQ